MMCHLLRCTDPNMWSRDWSAQQNADFKLSWSQFDNAGPFLRHYRGQNAQVSAHHSRQCDKLLSSSLARLVQADGEGVTALPSC
jgi:hypothetical protein